MENYIKKTEDVSIIDKSIISECWSCGGEGRLFTTVNNNVTVCPTCQGTGKWREPHYIIVDEKNKIAIDSDTGA